MVAEHRYPLSDSALFEQRRSQRLGTRPQWHQPTFRAYDPRCPISQAAWWPSFQSLGRVGGITFERPTRCGRS